MFHKNWEVFWNIFPFLHRWIWCDEVIKEYLKFYAYFTRMQKFFLFQTLRVFFSKDSCVFQEKKLVLFQRFLSMFFQKWLMITVHNIWLHHFSFSYSSMQHKHSQIQILSGQEINAYIRRLFSNCFDSRSDDISWTFIHKYLDI